MRPHRSTLMPAAVLALLFGVLAGGMGVAWAQDDDALTIPRGTVVRGSSGDVIELGRLPVDNTRAGPLCTWTATVMNQQSAHPGNDILVESNGVTLVLADVEAAPDKVTVNSGSVFLSDVVVVSLRLGADGVFSGGMDVAITYSSCGELPTTTVVVPTTTETLATTTQPTTETTTPDTTAGTEPEGPEVSAADDTTTTETTAAPAMTSTTVPPATDTLPVTGSELTLPLVVAGLVVSVVGVGLVSVSRRREA